MLPKGAQFAPAPSTYFSSPHRSWTHTQVVSVHSYAQTLLQKTFPSRTTPFPGGTMQLQLAQAHFTAAAEFRSVACTIRLLSADRCGRSNPIFPAADNVESIWSTSAGASKIHAWSVGSDPPVGHTEERE